MLTIRILGTAFAALVGLAFGSFLNVCLSRWPQGESVVKPRSHCRSCGRTLKWWENVPLASWLALRGRCRTCNAWFGWRYPLVELVIATLWAITSWRWLDPSALPILPETALLIQLARAVGLAFFFWLCVALAVLDAENFWLPDRLTWPGIVVGFTYSILLIPVGGTFVLFRRGNNVHLQAALASLIEMFIAAFLILLIRWTYKLIRKREGIGLGDAKLMAMLAAWLGLEGALLSFFIGVTLGSVAAVIAIAQHSKNANSEGWAVMKLPLGTFLSIGGIVSALWGQPIVAAYLHWAGF